LDFRAMRWSGRMTLCCATPASVIDRIGVSQAKDDARRAF
jgi:hypothetical protein